MTTINMAWPTGALAGGLCTVTTDKARGDDFPGNLDTVMCEYDGRITDVPFRTTYHRVTRVRCRTLGAKALESLDSESLDIKADVIEDGVFGSYGARNLKAVTLSGLNGDLASVSGNSFLSGCTGLTSLTLPASLASVSGSSFLSGCTGLTSLTLPASLASVSGSNFLYNCTGLTSLDVQDGFGSKNLSTTWLLDKVNEIATLTLRQTSGMWKASTWTSHLATGATVNVPATLLDAYKADTTWAKFNLQAIG